MTRRHARRHPIAAAVVVLVGLVAVVSIAAHLAGLVILAAVGAGGYALGRWHTRPPANARSLAQLNRHLNARLDATQAKLEAEIDRADRAEESARQARDTAAECPWQHWHAEPSDVGGKRAALLAQPLSGARPLGTR